MWCAVTWLYKRSAEFLVCFSLLSPSLLLLNLLKTKSKFLFFVYVVIHSTSILQFHICFLIVIYSPLNINRTKHEYLRRHAPIQYTRIQYIITMIPILKETYRIVVYKFMTIQMSPFKKFRPASRILTNKLAFFTSACLFAVLVGHAWLLTKRMFLMYLW